MFGLLGKKRGMSQVFSSEGELIPVTVVEVGPCVILQRKTKARDGYGALQLGFEAMMEKRASKAKAGHSKKAGKQVYRHLREFRLEGADHLSEGTTLTANVFQAGDVVHVSGVTKGRGFQGVMKRHGKHGGPAAHGSDFHRRPGSIGMRSEPGRVLKNTKLPGHMGVCCVTVKNLKVVAVRPEENAILVRGALPGARGSLVEIVAADPAFLQREVGKSAEQKE